MQEANSHNHDYIAQDQTVKTNEKKIVWVVVLTLVTMILEISYGHISSSMALLADGWHMGSHVGALGISWLAYRLARSENFKTFFSFGTGKFVPLAGYTSALFLAIMAIFMIAESIGRLVTPTPIEFSMALTVAGIGLVVNIVSAGLLQNNHENEHHDHHHDHNHESALIHVIADAFTSLLAILALLLGRYLNMPWADPLIGILGAIVILKWAYGLGKNTAWELLDGHAKTIHAENIKATLQKIEGVKILDFHIWRLAPNAHACEIVISSSLHRGPDYYREKILKIEKLEHLVIEERIK